MSQGQVAGRRQSMWLETAWLQSHDGRLTILNEVVSYCEQPAQQLKDVLTKDWGCPDKCHSKLGKQLATQVKIRHESTLAREEASAGTGNTDNPTAWHAAVKLLPLQATSAGGCWVEIPIRRISVSLGENKANAELVTWILRRLSCLVTQCSHRHQHNHLDSASTTSSDKLQGIIIRIDTERLNKAHFLHQKDSW